MQAQPNTVNFSYSRVAYGTTRSHASYLPTIVNESSLSVLEVPPPLPTEFDFSTVTIVQESKVDERLWHIAHVSYNSSKGCWAIHEVIKKNTLSIFFVNKKHPYPSKT